MRSSLHWMTELFIRHINSSDSQQCINFLYFIQMSFFRNIEWLMVAVVYFEIYSRPQNTHSPWIICMSIEQWGLSELLKWLIVDISFYKQGLDQCLGFGQDRSRHHSRGSHPGPVSQSRLYLLKHPGLALRSRRRFRVFASAAPCLAAAACSARAPGVLINAASTATRGPGFY